MRTDRRPMISKHRDRHISDQGVWQEKAWESVQRLLAAMLLVSAVPLLIILYFLVGLTSRGPFIYTQMRPGLGGRMFRVFKIRTMVQGADRDPRNARSVRSSDPSVTRVGRVLRDLKLDELPQLWNVVSGDMALVGPRPIAAELQKELERKIPDFGRRLTAKPGLSSLAQVCVLESGSQKNVVDDWRIRAEAEAHYLEYRSISYDLIVIMLTLVYFVKKFGRMAPCARRLAPPLCAALLIGILFSGCSSTLRLVGLSNDGDGQIKAVPVAAQGANSALLDVQKVKISNRDAKAPARSYRLGEGDEMRIDVFGEPGLSELTVRVDGEGYIQLPGLELVRVEGLNTRQIQKYLKDAYGRTFVDPWVVVRISQYRSHPVYLLGEFNKAGVVYLEGPTKLIQALAYGNGLSDGAFLRGARILRNGLVMPVDVYGLLRRGRTDQNIWLNPEDTVFIPHRRDQKIYMLGAIAKPGPVELGEHGLTLLEALGQTGGPLRAEAKLDQVRIIRTVSAIEGQLILVDAERILDGSAPDFRLKASDIVYVPLNAMADWNDAISAIAPAVRLIGGVLQPFVQLKFLQDN